VKATIIVPIFGDRDFWEPHAHAAVERSRQDVECEYIVAYADTLAKCRNRSAETAKGDWLVFLDADDMLSSNYVRSIVDSGPDIQQPLTQYPGAEPSYIEPYQSLYEGNHIVVGAPIRRKAFALSGGFNEFGMFEDWALWLKMRRQGATLGRMKGIYHVGPSLSGRNQGSDAGHWFQAVRRAYNDDEWPS
jgi:hypothetical protein